MWSDKGIEFLRLLLFNLSALCNPLSHNFIYIPRPMWFSYLTRLKLKHKEDTWDSVFALIIWFSFSLLSFITSTKIWFKNKCVSNFPSCPNSQPSFSLRPLCMDYICLLHRHHHIRNLIQPYPSFVRDISCSPWSWTPRPFQGLQSQKFGHVHQHFHHCNCIKWFPPIFPRIAKDARKYCKKTYNHPHSISGYY